MTQASWALKAGTGALTRVLEFVSSNLIKILGPVSGVVDLVNQFINGYISSIILI